MPTWLVTGGSGFLGRHLLAALAGRPGVEAVALGRRPPADMPGAAFVRADLDEPMGLVRAVAAVDPECVLHAAGATPSRDPGHAFRGNTRATHHLLEALHARGRPTRVVLLGSAAELGPVPTAHLPAGEDCACRPAEPYGLSKWAATFLGRIARPPLEVMTARVFNPIGPGMPTTQAFGRFAARLAEPGPDPLHLTVGDLDARRDFVDARDVADAAIALALRGRPGGVYHVGTGRSRRVSEGLGHLISLSRRPVVLEVRDALPRGPRDSRADIRRIAAEVGWTPQIAWETSLNDLWAEARGRAGLPLTPAPAPV